MTEKQYLITKRGGYYKPNSQGYTIFKHLAGRYTFADAQEITHPNGWTGPRDGMDYVHEDKAPICLDRSMILDLQSYGKYVIEQYKEGKDVTV